MFSDPQENIGALELEAGLNVIDVGAGVGHHTILIAKTVGASGHVYAVDVQKELLVKLQNDAKSAHLHNITIVHGNAEKLGGTRLKEGIADRIFISNVFFQIDHKESFVSEMRRLLSSGGKLVLVDWIDALGSSEAHGKMVVGPLEAEHLFEIGGFKKASSFEAGSHHYGLVFKKTH